jgi:hypothetical protein
VNVETKGKSKQRIYTHSPKKPKSLKKSLPGRKLMANDLWEKRRLLMEEFMQEETTIT